MNFNPIKARKERKIQEAIKQMNQDENFKFLLKQYNEASRIITCTGKDKKGNAVFGFTTKQQVLKTSIQDYYKKRYKILYKNYGELNFEKEIVTCEWLLNQKSDKVH